jgi:hypothetical protein
MSNSFQRSYHPHGAEPLHHEDENRSQRSVVKVARLLLMQQQQHHAIRHQNDGEASGEKAALSPLPEARQHQELSAFTAGELSDLCYLLKSTRKSAVAYEPMNPFYVDSELQAPQCDPRRVEARLMALYEQLDRILVERGDGSSLSGLP